MTDDLSDIEDAFEELQLFFESNCLFSVYEDFFVLLPRFFSKKFDFPSEFFSL